MSKLTASQRDALPASDFALPDSREYPLTDEAHAEQALRELHNATPAEQLRIKAAIAARFPHLAKTGSSVIVRGKHLSRNEHKR